MYNIEINCFYGNKNLNKIMWDISNVEFTLKDNIRGVHALDRGNYMFSKNYIPHLFSEVLRCGECSGDMCYRESYNGYKCSNSQKQKGVCTSHSIKEEYLKEYIVKSLRYHVKCKVYKEEFYDWAYEKARCKDIYKMRLNIIDKKIISLKDKFKKVYLDKIVNKIDERNFENMVNNIQTKHALLSSEKNKVLKIMKSNKALDDIYKVYEKSMDDTLQFNNVKKYMIDKLVDSIVVYEDKINKTKQLDINYKFKI
ncbi:zinc ribbon domain-containing protein [Clostridium botulinum]|uniref:Resolvase n=1 Tax=Clostridium botulinum C/D str. DC5 TaxID=1443128 RepID=A0A0A0IFY7_CLOBO|nr:zinc ribbon domain-containing protein [Clostridium botulinum]KEI00549.1 resolvase [Clostridium botulinum C/D str. BKT75002]KEI11206.1 resolvase [Clostridium botulinum C/D str. BKT2873]KGM93662.1 resolvase [Clostridium botulinum D str. CCUG 7971]KGM99468.1 resolvase [Clostridium botulinum C/D str. DC5]KOC47817.1 resolvase [Clostridium botulinum]